MLGDSSLTDHFVEQRYQPVLGWPAAAQHGWRPDAVTSFHECEFIS